ncbi:MAG TPA: acyltransferase [Sphingomicrobium sp.]|nr:acyltransferase [Sphingomicrobium sp.]
MKLRSIQCLRAVAVTAVLLSHTLAWRHGAAGVDLFFVISGVIIGIVMKGRSASQFMLARLRRIYPIYWLNLFPIIAAAAISGIALDQATLASSATLWPIWGDFAQPYLPPAWTLCFEMLFYVVVAIGLATSRTTWVAPALLVLVVLNALVRHPVLQFVGNPLVLEFCAGFAILRLPRNSSAGVAALALGVGLFVLSPSIYVQPDQLMDISVNLLRVAVWGLPAALLVYAALTFERLFTKWADIPVFVGNASYSIYLSHYFVILTLNIWWPAQTAAMLLVGCAMYLWIEQPMLKRKPMLNPAPARA